MSTWQATPRGLALATHAKNQLTQHPCPNTCPICTHIEWEAQQFAEDLDAQPRP
jgi:hypothetical protein